MTGPDLERLTQDDLRQALDSLTALYMAAYRKDPDRTTEIADEFIRRGQEITGKDNDT